MLFRSHASGGDSAQPAQENTSGFTQTLTKVMDRTGHRERRPTPWLLVWATLPALLLVPDAWAVNNRLAATPPMGWNSWNHFGCTGLIETVIEQTATAMANNGMKAAGFQIINLDDCWMATSRNTNGNLVPDPTKFPSGMPALVSYVHNLDLKIGLYEDAGTATCQKTARWSVRVR